MLTHSAVAVPGTVHAPWLYASPQTAANQYQVFTLLLASIDTQVWNVSATLHILLVSMHHSITDGWSVNIMQSELAAAYTAACSGTQPGWQPLPVQVVDYAAWQRSHLQLEDELAWWEATLAGAPPLLELPCDRPRPDVFSHRGAHVQLTVPALTSSSIAELAAQHQTTPFVVVLTALQVGACIRNNALYSTAQHILRHATSHVGHNSEAGPRCKIAGLACKIQQPA